MRNADGFEGGTDVAGALPGPNHIAKGHRRVVESGHADAAIERSSEKGITGAKTGAQDANLLIALLLQPIDAATDVDDRLAAGGDGASDVGADRIISSRQLRRTADIVVRLAQAQGRHAKAGKGGAQSVVTKRIGIPVRHDDHCLL